MCEENNTLEIEKNFKERVLQKTDDDKFLNLSKEAQLLYFNLVFGCAKDNLCYKTLAIARSIETGWAEIGELIENKYISEVDGNIYFIEY